MSCTYRVDGKLSVRTWARGGSPLTTTYTYYDTAGSNNTGELEMINYSESTPDVTFDSYDRVGRVTQVSDAVGTRTFSFDPELLTLSTEAINTSGNTSVVTTHPTRVPSPHPPARCFFGKPA